MPADDTARGQARTTQSSDAVGTPVEAAAIDDLPLPILAPYEWFGAKVDVEGAAPQVIDGMRRLLCLGRCVLQVEVMAVDRTKLDWRMS